MFVLIEMAAYRSIERHLSYRNHPRKFTAPSFLSRNIAVTPAAPSLLYIKMAVDGSNAFTMTYFCYRDSHGERVETGRHLRYQDGRRSVLSEGHHLISIRSHGIRLSLVRLFPTIIYQFIYTHTQTRIYVYTYE